MGQKVDFNKPVRLYGSQSKLNECAGHPYMDNHGNLYLVYPNGLGSKFTPTNLSKLSFSNSPVITKRYMNVYAEPLKAAVWRDDRETADAIQDEWGHRIAVLVETCTDGVYTYERIAV